MTRWIWLIFCLPTLAWAAPTTQPIAVPYTLTDTNHLLVRLKINGHGPYNFIVDTGAPAMILRIPVADKIGLKRTDGLATLDQLEIEGGVKLQHVQCVVETPYQIEGMNAVGASGVDLDGLLGYGILSRFRMQIDLSKNKMLWTPVNYSPPVLKERHHPTAAEHDNSEATLEATGTLLKVLGPLVKPIEMPSQHRGVIGVELSENTEGVNIKQVLGNGPADRAGIETGDRLSSVNGEAIRTIADAQNAMFKLRAGKTVTLVVSRNDAELTLKIICRDEL